MGNTTQTFHPTALAAVNRALAVLGQDVMLTAAQFSVGSDDAHGRKAAWLYEGSRQAVLRDHAWAFAERVVDEPGSSRTHGAGLFRFLTQRPGKCVRIRGCFADDGRLAYWRVGPAGIESDEPLRRIVYTSDVDDLDKWSPDAYRALVLRIAADLAKPVTGRINERQLQEQAYAEALADAKLHDSREQNVPYDAYGTNHYVDAMLGGRPPRRDTFRR